MLRDSENELLVALMAGTAAQAAWTVTATCSVIPWACCFSWRWDGKAVCVSDGSMQATQCGPIRQNDMQQGEVYDARFEGSLTGWHGVHLPRRSAHHRYEYRADSGT